MQKQLEHLLQKEMSRKEFLATLAFGLGSILGFSSLIKILNNRQRSAGYGSSPYGGNRKN